MSDAAALQATEQARELVANPERMGLERRKGLEPRDVLVKFNRAAAHTSSAFQAHVQMRITLDDGATWRDERALVAEGKTKAECLEVFYNWMADPHAMATFHEVVRQSDAAKLDALAQAELSKAAAEQGRVNGVAKDNNRNWAERKLDALGRKFGFVKGKVQA